MVLLIVVVLIIVISKYLIENKLVIRFDTFFRKGFKITKDVYRRLLFHSVNKETGKHIPFVIL